MRCFYLVAAVLLAAAAFAQDAQLGTLRATMATLHSHAAAAAADFKTRGGSPELTVAKHQLRDWIETQLGSLKDFGEEQAFAARINEALKAVDATNTGDDQNFLGSVGDVRVSSESGLLIITTGVGILCEYDESAYGYKREDGRWQRIWKSEHNDYSDKYAPQNVIAVHVLQTFKDGHENGPAFVMTLGNDGGCASSWRTVYYRVWRVDSVGSKLLIDEAEFAWFRAETYSVGSIIQDWRDKNAPVDVLVEFTERSVDAAVHNREAIRHFLIDGDRVRRIDPVALSPRDFVDEWLTQNWNASATWSASPMMQQWHRRLHADFVAGHFSDVTMHCQTPDLWQVTFQPKNAQKNFEPEPKVYFLVRWRPPYHFTMVNVVDKPWPLCTQEDREADEWRTLFSTQEWRR